MRIRVYQESTPKGKTLLHLLDEPGCIVKGLDQTDALRRLPEGVRSYMYWRRQHGFAALPDPYEFSISEEQPGGPFHPGNKAALFSADVLPVSNLERDEYIALITASRQDLLVILAGMPARAFQLWLDTPGWSVFEILRHIASAERFYITRLFESGSVPRSRVSKDIFDRLNYMRGNCLIILQNLTEEERSKRVLAGGEEWTARKVFRRFIEHEREHIGQILRILYQKRDELALSFDLQEMIRQYRGISWKEQYAE